MQFGFLHVRILARGIKNKYLSRFLTFPIKEARRQEICLSSLFVRLFLCCREMWCLLLMIPNAHVLYDQSGVQSMPALSVEGCMITCDPSDRNHWALAKKRSHKSRWKYYHTVCRLILALSWQQPTCRKPTLCSHKWVKFSCIIKTEFLNALVLKIDSWFKQD